MGLAIDDQDVCPECGAYYQVRVPYCANGHPRPELARAQSEAPKVLWHHGTCDSCRRRHSLVCHFGYATQDQRSYRMCLSCLREQAQVILYGWMSYKVDGHIDRLIEEDKQVIHDD